MSSGQAKYAEQQEEDYEFINQILSVGKYFLLESAVTGHFELHKVKPEDNMFNLWRYIPTKQLYLFTP
jgi:hypothetical protein